MESPDFKGNEIHVHNLEEGIVSLSYFISGEIYVMKRGTNEPISKTIFRLGKSINQREKFQKQQSSKQSKKGQRNPVSNASSNSLTSGTPDDTDYVSFEGFVLDCSQVLNSDWKTGMIVHVCRKTFSVLCDPPIVLSMSVFPRKECSVGFPIACNVTALYTTNLDYLWCDAEIEGYLPLCREKIFIPSITDANRRLKLFCTPWRFVQTDGIPGSVLNLAPPDPYVIRGRTTTLYITGRVKESFLSPKALEYRQIFTHTPKCVNGIPLPFEMSASAITKSKVAGDDSSAYSRDEDNIRVVTYNVLSDTFATSESALSYLYPYCPAEFLEAEYRAQLIAQELLAYDADIICLQECDCKTFDAYFNILLAERGYSGHYTNKVSGVREGCAMFTKDCTLRVLRRIDLPLKSVLRDDPSLRQLYAVRPDLRDVIGGKLGTVAQVALCQCMSASRRVVLVANTHLFYHPAAGFIRLLQTHAIISAMKVLRHSILRGGIRSGCLEPILGTEEPLPEDLSIISREEEISGPINVAAIFVGDLNSTGETAVIEYLVNGSCRRDHEEWNEESLGLFFWGTTGDEIPEELEAAKSLTKSNATESCCVGAGVDGNQIDSSSTFLDGKIPPASQKENERDAQILPNLSHDFKFVSASGFPAFTNYTKGFKDVLDYVFIDSDCLELVTNGVAAFPPEEVLSENVALPSRVFPSDHLAVVVDVRFRPQDI